MLALSATGCLVAPYPVSSDITIDEQVALTNDVILTLEPSKLLEEFSTDLENSYKNVEIIDGSLFQNAAFPEGVRNLSQLLKPEICSRVNKQLDVAFLVVVGPDKLTRSKSKDAYLPPIIGAGSQEKVSKISAIIIDMKTGEMVCQISSEAHGKDRYAVYIVVIAGTIPLTRSSAINGLAQETGRVISELALHKKVRVAVMAAESTFIVVQESVPKQLLSPKEIEKQAEEFTWILSMETVTYCSNADLGHADAQKHIADLHYFGPYGLKRDFIQAYVWYSLAANGGNKYSAKQLGQLTNELSPQQLDKAKLQLEEWEPGQCERDLMKPISVEKE